MDDGYILIHRKIKNWQWYQDSNTKSLFIDLLLEANFEDSKVGFEIIKRGQCLTSLKRIHENTGLTYQQIRTSLSKLEKSQEINKQTTNRYSIITINNYDDYQKPNKQTTNKQQTNNNIKRNKEINNKETISKDIVKKVFTKPTIDEIRDCCKEKNYSVDPEQFYNFYESKGWYVGKSKMVSWKSCLATWQKRNDKDNHLPDWFDKDFKKTDTDLKELNELLKGF